MAGADKSEEILDAAERMARRGGYNGFSFREVASAVGVKSSSVHYHFPTKQDLAVAMAKRYTENFLKSLGDPTGYSSASAAIEAYKDAYRRALIEDGLMCLCGIMGAESEHLPLSVRAETKAFFQRNLDWLVEVYSHHRVLDEDRAKRKLAAHVIATLEGGLILARTTDDIDLFEGAASYIPNLG